MLLTNRTVCAISTPSGVGGIAIIRITGADSVNIIKKIFPIPAEFESHKLYYGFIKDNFSGKEIDEVLVTVMLSPRSYTKEDVAEIHCHGGYVIAEEILELLIKNGCSVAEPGEFTKRAFLNGRIDLSQAEAIMEVINAKNRIAAEISEKHLKGFLKKKVNEIKKNIINILSVIEGHLDFFEDADSFEKKDILQTLKKISEQTEAILNSYGKTKKYYQGVNLVIAGPPNAGKSSLLNYILKQERAITSKIPGTTRDTIEEEIFINHIPVKVIDTAGIRETNDEIEAEGVIRAIEKVKEADIVLYIFDRSIGLKNEDKNFIFKIGDKELILIGNKSDLIDEEKRDIGKESEFEFFPVSIKENINMKQLEKFISDKITENDKFHSNDIILTNLRHFNLFEKFKEKTDNAVRSLIEDNPLDMVCFDLHEAVKELEKITGEITTEDVLNKIFSNFCVGK